MRTSAVMAMVGYIVGLGDRHCENILFDQLTGDCIHVDFNCLFEKAKTLETPETVPFRLTHNLVDAFGVTGYEGVFRRCCEVSLRVLRDNKETLMTVMETFIHDPLLEWSKKVCFFFFFLFSLSFLFSFSFSFSFFFFFLFLFSFSFLFLFLFLFLFFLSLFFYFF